MREQVFTYFYISKCYSTEFNSDNDVINSLWFESDEKSMIKIEEHFWVLILITCVCTYELSIETEK